MTASEQCPATTRHASPPLSTALIGLQCKFTRGHDGDHCANAFPGEGDVFWPQQSADDSTMASDEDRIRDAMAEAQDHPGRVITR